MRPNVDKLIKNLIAKAAGGAGGADAQNEDEATVEANLNQFFDTHMVALEKKVESLQGVCCEMITYLDLLIYNEIRSVLVLYGTKLKRKETPNLNAWYENMTELCPPVIELNTKFDEVCKSKGIGIRKDNFSSN